MIPAEFVLMKISLDLKRADDGFHLILVIVESELDSDEPNSDYIFPVYGLYILIVPSESCFAIYNSNNSACSFLLLSSKVHAYS